MPNELSSGIYQGLSGLAGGLQRHFESEETLRKKEEEDFKKQQLLRNLLMSFQSYKEQPATPGVPQQAPAPQLRPDGSYGPTQMAPQVTPQTRGVDVVPFGRKIGSPGTVDALSQAASEPGVLSQFMGMRNIGIPTYDIMNQEGGGYDIFQKGEGQVPVRVGGRAGTATKSGSPYSRAKLDEAGNPVFRSEGGARLQEYELIDPNTKQSMGSEFKKIDDESRAGLPRESILNTVAGRFLADPSVRKDVQMIDASDTIVSLLDSGNPVADNAIPTFMARASGEVGNLSEADKAPFGGSAALTQRIAQVAQRATTGALTADNRQFVKSLALVMSKSAKVRRSNMAKQYAKTYSKANKGKIEEADILDMLDEGTQQLSPEDQEAVDWARQNPNDPRSAQILKLHGIQ